MRLPITQTLTRAPPPHVVARLTQPATLHDAIGLGLAVVNVVIQDEYTHDVVVSAGEVFAVYDST